MLVNLVRFAWLQIKDSVIQFNSKPCGLKDLANTLARAKHNKKFLYNHIMLIAGAKATLAAWCLAE